MPSGTTRRTERNNERVWPRPALAGTAGWLLLLTLLLAAPAGAAPDGDLLDRVLQALARDAPRQLAFTETRDDPLLDLPETREGHLAFQPPDTLVRSIAGPGGETVTIEGRQLVVERRGSRRTIDLDEQPGLDAFANLFRALLGADRAALEADFELAVSGESDAWQLELVPRDRTLRRMLPSLELSGSHGDLHHLITVEAGGHTSRMRFHPASEADAPPGAD